MSRFFRRSLVACCLMSLLAFLALPSRPQSSDDDDDQETNTTAAEIREHYTKHEYRIPMRDGTKLFTAVYIPKDTSQSYPFLIDRTPYSVGPYGVDHYPKRLGPSPVFVRDGFIFVDQDVRGRYLSEGTFVEVTPPKTKKSRKISTKAPTPTTPSSGSSTTSPTTTAKPASGASPTMASSPPPE